MLKQSPKGVHAKSVKFLFLKAINNLFRVTQEILKKIYFSKLRVTFLSFYKLPHALNIFIKLISWIVVFL